MALDFPSHGLGGVAVQRRSFAPALAVALALAAPAASTLAAASDVEGSADPPGVQRFPDAWIVAYSPSVRLRGYSFVTGRVDRSSRAWRADRSERVAAEVVRVTYRAPDGVQYEDVLEHYRGLLDEMGAELSFGCRGRACGRSTVWANDVFGVKELVAPDSAQAYLAAKVGRNLISIYVIQRGNRRVYAHVDLAQSDALAAGPATEGVGAALARQGFAVLPNLAPDDSGAIAAQALDAFAVELKPFAERTLHVVCHFDGVYDAALQHSKSCAEQAAAQLRALGFDARSFGAGPLLPRTDAPSRRIELVLSDQ